MHADLRADLLPWLVRPRQIRRLSTTMTKCGLPVETSTPAISTPSASSTVCGANDGHAHPGGDFHGESPSVFDRVHVADAHARIGFDLQVVAGLQAAFSRHPRGHAARAVAADLGDGAVGVVQANAARLRPGPRKELDAVGADAGIARAEPPRQLCPIVTCAPPLPSQSESRCRRRELW